MLQKILASNSLQLPELQISCLYFENTKNSKTTTIEGLPIGFEGKDHQEKGYTNLMCDSPNKSRNETPPNPSHKKSQEKAPKIIEKEKWEEEQVYLRNHTKPSIHTMKDS
jgi:hypothetical protein